jgi:2,4-dienoyl-CoA reductase-like NADH-dependent reductase (Old Yellow Enzyme family)/L-alanine-DL-glutamate epimerase-like enolase superfamily enzyme
MKYRRLASLDGPAAFRAYAASLGIELPFDEEVLTGPDAPLARPYRLADGAVIGNRFCVQPMEGWDAAPDGKPTELTLRRWRRFGRSGAKLVWGGEAVAVAHEGRANPRQLWINEANLPALAALRRALVEAHEEQFGRTDDLLVGLQITHSGRFCRPNRDDRPEPRIVYRHPVLDRRVGVASDQAVLTDAQVEAIADQFVQAARMAQEAGFDFVDVKHCHGYLGHEFLSAFTRPGPFGGSFENRTRFLRLIVEGIRRTAPGLRVGVRASVFDTPPFRPGPDGVGTPEEHPLPYVYAFGADTDHPLRPKLNEAELLLALLEEMGVQLVNLSGGSPYYNPHVMRPALFPPSDGYLPPEDPLVGVARHVGVVRQLKRKFPRLAVVGSGYTYLQEWLPHVAQAAVRTGAVDFVGLGRMMLAYPEMPADVLAGRALRQRCICRTFSDCTTAPRRGLVSGCYPLDEFYRRRPEARELEAVRTRTGGRRLRTGKPAVGKARPEMSKGRKDTDVRPVAVSLHYLPIETRMPLKFGPETLTHVTLARVRLTVRDAKGRTADGWGETPLSVEWVWPSSLKHEERHLALKAFSEKLAQEWAEFDVSGHPMEVGYAFINGPLVRLLEEFNEARAGREPMPWLAALVCCSLFDIALHDAYGVLHGVPVYKTYNAKYMNADLAQFLTPAEASDVTFAGRYPQDYFVKAPRKLVAWHLVAGKDPVDESELTGKEPDDGYPVLLRDWVRQDGLKCLKVKLRGNDPEWDYDRLTRVGRLACEEGVDWLTSDFNCTVTEPAYVTRILDRLVDEEPRIYGMILYVEQPFPYDLEKYRIDVHSVSARKPLFMDESAHDWHLVRLGRTLGWSGVALKTCKTQTGALLSLCWAKAHGMTLMVQDLSNPTLAQIPHVLLAAHAGTIMGVETNAMQFYPEVSLPEAEVHPGVYRRRKGCIDISTLRGPGFGYRIDEMRRKLPRPVVKCKGR